MQTQKCQQCNAPLPLGPAGSIVPCPFCGTQNRMAGAAPAPAPRPPIPPIAPHLVQVRTTQSHAGLIVTLVVVTTVLGIVGGVVYAITSAIDSARTTSYTVTTTTTTTPANGQVVLPNGMVVQNGGPGGVSITLGPGTLPEGITAQMLLAGMPPGTRIEGVEVVAPDAPAKLPPAKLSTLKLDSGSTLVDAPGTVGPLERFDPPANYDWALGLARAWSADARLERMDASGVTPDGVLDVSASGAGTAGFRFFSPARLASAEQLARVSEEKVASELMLWVKQGEVTAQLGDYSPFPGDEQRRDEQPPCSLAQVVEKLRADGMPLRPHYDLTLTWRSDHWGWWTNMTDIDGSFDVRADACTAARRRHR